VAKIIISGPGNIISLKKIANAVGMRNINTVKNYLGYLQDSYLVKESTVKDGIRISIVPIWEFLILTP
jgi:predicted AAA+ superfamily ATPase